MRKSICGSLTTVRCDQRNDSTYTCRPVTIRQLLDAKREHSEASFKIDGQEVHRVRTAVLVLICAVELLTVGHCPSSRLSPMP